MVRNIHTSRKSSSRARMAGKVLRDPEASGPSKSVAASILSESKPKAKPEKKADKKTEKKAEAKPEKKAKAKKE